MLVPARLPGILSRVRIRTLRALWPGLLATSLAAVASPMTQDLVSLVDVQFLRNHAETRGFSLGRPIQPRPTPDGRAVVFLRAQPRSPGLALHEFDVATGVTRLLLTPEDILKGAEENLSPDEKARRERMRVSLAGFTSFQLSEDGRLVLLSLSGKLHVLDRSRRSVQLLNISGTPIDPQFSPNGRLVAYVRNHDIHVFDLDTSTETQVTTGGTETVSHGSAEFVAQEEMGRFSGYWWSPDSSQIAFQRTDNRDVEIWHVADPAKPELTPYASRYPRPGKANARVTLGVVPAHGGPTVWAQWDAERYPYLTTVRWEKHGPLTLAVQTRGQGELVLLEADPNTGATQILLAEHDDTWVNVRQDMPRWLAAGRGFLWASERQGAWQLEWRGRHGALEKVMVPPRYGFTELLGCDPVTGEVLFTGRPDATQQRVYHTTIEGGTPVELSSQPGWHSAIANDCLSLHVQTTATLNTMPRHTVHRRDGTRLGELPSLAEDPPFVPHVELIYVGNDPGFHAALVRPRNFNPVGRYPVILHIYGGPLPYDSSGVVTASMGSWLLRQWIADQGFVVVCVDGRGTPGRGRDWERAIFKQLGTVPLADLVTAFHFIAQRFPELDRDRVGVYGWSFGGYLSALAVLKEPDLFKTAVAGAPVTDWADYDTHYTERYLGMPQMDAEAYRQASLLNWVPGLRRPLLLVHGTDDDNVYFRHTLRLADALFRSGRHFELLPLSGFSHMVPDPLVNEQLYSRIIRHFKNALGEPISPSQ